MDHSDRCSPNEMCDGCRNAPFAPHALCETCRAMIKSSIYLNNGKRPDLSEWDQPLDCDFLYSDRVYPVEKIPWHSSFRQWSKAVEAECHLYILLWLEARTKFEYYRSSMEEDEEAFKKHFGLDELPIQVYKKIHSRFAELHMVCGGIEMGNLAVYRDTQFEASMRSSATASILKSPYSLAARSYETSSDAHISLANAWISECHDNHVKCLLAQEIHA